VACERACGTADRLRGGSAARQAGGADIVTALLSCRCRRHVAVRTRARLAAAPPPASGEPPMSTLARARLRTAGAVLVLSLSASACADLGGGAGAALPQSLAPGQAAGTVVVAASGDPAALVKSLQAAITAGGGTVAAVVDHAAAAKDVGVQIPPNTVVIGGPAAANTGLVNLVQTAGANLPPPYQVRQDDAGKTVLAYDSAEYLSAIGQVPDPTAQAGLATAASSVLKTALPGAPATTPAPLVGVTPVDYLLKIFGSTSVAGAVDLFKARANARAGDQFIASVDFVPDTAPRVGKAVPPPPGPRATSVVLISRPAAEAPLIKAAPSIGLDLPLRFVVWLDDQGRTQIGYPDVRRIALRHGIKADDPNVVALAAEADKLARLGAGVDNK
jgi:uncharacterized protein (DUF302 family)